MSVCTFPGQKRCCLQSKPAGGGRVWTHTYVCKAWGQTEWEASRTRSFVLNTNENFGTQHFLPPVLVTLSVVSYVLSQLVFTFSLQWAVHLCHWCLFSNITLYSLRTTHTFCTRWGFDIKKVFFNAATGVVPSSFYFRAHDLHFKYSD